jgi:hypothetical protein
MKLVCMSLAIKTQNIYLISYRTNTVNFFELLEYGDTRHLSVELVKLTILTRF